MDILIAIFVGVAVGILSGLVGVGGGILLIPILVYFYHMNQHKAQGTSLAMLLAPSGILAFWKYYRAANPEWRPDLKLGLLIAFGVFLGGWLGAKFALELSNSALRKVFAGFLLLVAVQLFFRR